MIAVTLPLLENNKKILGENKNSKFANVIGIAAVVWLTFLSVNQMLLWFGIKL